MCLSASCLCVYCQIPHVYFSFTSSFCFCLESMPCWAGPDFMGIQRVAMFILRAWIMAHTAPSILLRDVTLCLKREESSADRPLAWTSWTGIGACWPCLPQGPGGGKQLYAVAEPGSLEVNLTFKGFAHTPPAHISPRDPLSYKQLLCLKTVTSSAVHCHASHGLMHPEVFHASS